MKEPATIGAEAVRAVAARLARSSLLATAAACDARARLLDAADDVLWVEVERLRDGSAMLRVDSVNSSVAASCGHHRGVLVPASLAAPIADGAVTLLYRRWRRCQAVAGHVYRTSAGRLLVTEVSVVDPTRVSTSDARRSGCADRAELLAGLRGEAGWPVYRLRVCPATGPDERAELAASAHLDSQETARLTSRLARLDRASSHGPWTEATLALIEKRPGVRAGDLATSVGRDMLPFKVDVRKLKNLGLTISLDVGYRLSPRGLAYVDSVRSEAV